MIGTATAIGLGLAATSAAGAVAGAIPKSSTQTVDAGQATDRERQGLGLQDRSAKELEGLTAVGPGERDVTASLGATRDLAGMLDEYTKSGGLPGQNDISAASGFAGSIFDPQRTALKQSFVEQTTEANRQAALLGRSVDDPILQAKLRTGMMNQEAKLNSEQGAFGSQLALSLPGQRLGLAGQRADILSNLASQAFSNRSALLALGSGIAGAERQFRLNTATRKSETGGGLGGALEGGLAGFGTGMKLFGAGGGFNFDDGAGTGAGFVDPFAGTGTAAANAGMQASPLAPSSIPMDMGVGFGQSAPGFGTKNYSLGF